MQNKVVIEFNENAEYPQLQETRPSVKYPEYQFEELSKNENNVYDMVRNGLYRMEYDVEHYGMKEWNPLGNLIIPGNTVLIKPNLVMHSNPSGDGVQCLYTQVSVIAPIIDYVVIALKGNGKIIVGDAPMQECQFDILKNESGLQKLIDYYKKKEISIELVDFRELTSQLVKGIHVNTINKESKGTVIDLGNDSAFAGYDKEHMHKMRITNYNPQILQMHHDGTKNEYYISDYLLNADVIINMPKPKTHRKAGVTIALKNLVGINIRKEFLPHHTTGAIEEGGDEYLKKNWLKSKKAIVSDKMNYYAFNNMTIKARVWRLIYETLCVILHFYKDRYSEGSWSGNNTISKTITDLNKIIFYVDKNGKMCDTIQRKMFIVADMIISGEKEGPVMPSAKKVGIIAMGENPIWFDQVIATIMGADISRIPTIKEVTSIAGKYKIVSSKEGCIYSNDARWNNKKIDEISKEDLLYFTPTSGWREVFFTPNK